MDLVAIVERLVPDVEWVGNVTNDATVAKLQETFYSPSGASFPTNQEGIAEWQVILAERAAEDAIADEMADLAKANTYLTGALTTLSIPVPDRIILRDTLLRMFKYLKYGK